MDNIAVAQSGYQKDDTFEEILRYLKFGITLIGACAYGVEKALRLPTVAAGVADEMEALIDSPVNKVIGYLNVLSYACTVSTFFDPLFRQEGSILCFDFKGDSQGSRRIFGIIVLCLAGVGIIYVFAKNKTTISAKKKAWQRPMSLVSNGGLCIYGFIQLIIISTKWDYYKDQKLFAISSVIINLSSPVEMYGIDRKLYEAEKRGLVYAAVYGARTAAKISQAIGILKAGK